jgi:hypothetical protein
LQITIGWLLFSFQQDLSATISVDIYTEVCSKIQDYNKNTNITANHFRGYEHKWSITRQQHYHGKPD